MEILTTREAAMNARCNNKLKCEDLKYQKKTNEFNQAKQNPNISEKSKSKYEVCGHSNHAHKDRTIGTRVIIITKGIIELIFSQCAKRVRRIRK